jgi:LmbE family N-acetylglucosaminyl deacetylase
MKYQSAFLALAALLFTISAKSQNLGAGEIIHQLKKLQKTNRVLYIAAHPDDENTRVISWLENDRAIRTAYLSLTRGDGGQNLIGTELGAKLGVLRTQELMQARQIDGGEQFFTRAVDFGYSKTADETFKQWDKDQVLADVVWVIRKFQPDVIITRFPADARGGHGHHTASAMLAEEAFALAASKDAYPEQLQYLAPWQTKRLFWNHSTWWNQDLDSIAAADKRYTVIDIGTYIAPLGLSCNELASFSRTQHKSQGFGVSVDRGSRKEYLQLIKGQPLENDFMDDVQTGWARYGWPDGDAQLQALLDKFNPQKPYTIAEDILDLLQASDAINSAQQKDWFQTELQKLFVAVTGISLELLAKNEFISPGQPTNFTLEYVNRCPLPLHYFKGSSESLPTADVDVNNETENDEQLAQQESVFGALSPLPFNETVSREVKNQTLATTTSQPYWLQKPYNTMFSVSNQLLIGAPENSPALELLVPIYLNKKVILIPIKAKYKYSDRVEGEIQNPLLVTPKFTVNPAKSNLIFVDNEAQYLTLDLRPFTNGTLKFKAKADGWRIEPEQMTVDFNEGLVTKSIRLKVSPTQGVSKTTTLLILDQETNLPLQSIAEINYEHIDKRVVFEEASLKLVKLDLAIKGQRIAYIKGAGDEVATAISQMGYQVDFLDEQSLKTADLQKYQAVVAGIRAYNTQEWLPAAKEKIMAYVQNGGTYIVQYNTASRDLLSQNIGLEPFKISRERVTEENAAVRFALPNHPILNSPNKLGTKDFENWVQERGLYFASEWSQAYAAPLAWHDADEPDRLGGLLVANHGQGAFIYTGISFFRELPAGVEGAYRLWANILSYKP